MRYIMAELRIKEVCKEKGVKVMDLSTMIGVSQTNTSNIINGKVNPSLETLEKIASALNVPMWQLFASPEEVAGDNGLTAPIQHKKDFYKTVTIEELKKIVTEIEEKAD